MTINGGKPHAVGDRGQRYEVSYETEDGNRKVFGWASTEAGAQSFVDCINLHPVWDKPEVRDRESGSQKTQASETQ